MIAGVERGTTKDRWSACKQKVVWTQACWPTQPELIPVFIVGVLSLPPRWDVTRLSWQLASTHVYSWEERERHCESEVFCLRTQHVDPAWSRTQTSRPGLFHWPWGQCHRQHIQFTFILLRWSVMDWFLSVSKQFASQIECDRNLAFGDAAKLKLEASAHVFYHSWLGP